MSLLTQLRDLVALLTKSVNALEEICQAGTVTEDFLHPNSGSHCNDPSAIEATSTISAAALHICALVNRPEATLFEVVGGPMKAAALRICVESNVTEILREAGPQGMHIDNIAVQNKQDPSVLGACLRYLATYHIFKEIEPNIFANTPISSLLDTKKSSQTLLTSPDTKYENTTGFTAFVSMLLDEPFKSAAYSWEFCSDADAIKSGEPSQSSFSKFIGNGKTLWEYYDAPEHGFKRHRLNIAMHGAQKLQPGNNILHAYDWENVSPGATLVDVGGGIGTAQLGLAKEFPKLKIIIQDRDHVIKDGIKMWREENLDAIESGRVAFEAHDFFCPQPKRDVSFFFLRQVLHDWSDKYCCKILSQLRKAASDNTKLLSMETVVPYTCRDNSTNSVPGAVPDEAPAPLLANWGAINVMEYRASLTVLCQFNAKERTIGDAISLFEQSGWKIVEVHRKKRSHGSYLQCIEAIPI